MNHKIRDIIESQQATINIVESEKKYSRFEDLWNGITWRLARDPFDGNEIRDSKGNSYYIIKTPNNKENQISITILYKIINDDCLEIISIKIEELHE